MGNYSNDADGVRVDFFNPQGKWKYTEAVKWTGGWDKSHLIHEAFARTLGDHLRIGSNYRMRGLVAVCLKPYHELAHPLMLNVDTAINMFEKDLRHYAVRDE